MNVCACPLPPTATQNDDDGHDTELDAPMLVGFSTSQLLPNATNATRSALITAITRQYARVIQAQSGQAPVIGKWLKRAS